MSDMNQKKDERIGKKIFFWLDKVAKMMMLNVLVIVFSLPIFTMGAAIAAMHKCLQLILEDEEYRIIGDFWRAFKENFKKATVIWLVYLGVFALLGFDLIILRNGQWLEATWLQIPLLIIGVVALASCTWSLVLQTHYENKPLATIRNSFVFCLAYLWVTILMMLAVAVPALLIYISLYTVPVVGFLGLPGVGILQAMLYTRVFDKLDDEREKAALEAQEAAAAKEDEE